MNLRDRVFNALEWLFLARMHSRKKGKSRSHKPYVQGSYAWVGTPKDQVLEIIGKLAKEGKSEAQIGQVLRDQYGVPSTKVVLEKSVSGAISAPFGQHTVPPATKNLRNSA